MNTPVAFGEVLESAELLDPEAQAELVAVLSRRLAERGRAEIASSVAQARQEFAAGQCRPLSAAEILHEAQQ